MPAASPAPITYVGHVGRYASNHTSGIERRVVSATAPATRIEFNRNTTVAALMRGSNCGVAFKIPGSPPSHWYTQPAVPIVSARAETLKTTRCGGFFVGLRSVHCAQPPKAETTTAALGPHTISLVKSTTWQTVSDESLPATGIVIFATDAARDSPINTASTIECELSSAAIDFAITRAPASDTAAT